MTAIVETHRWLGTSSALLALLSVALYVLSGRLASPVWRRAYLTALGLSAILIVATGHFGAALVYGLDYYFR